MKYYVTSDTHFNHTNILVYCGRPFDSVEAMNASIIATWNQIVSPGDIVYHLGDMAMGNKVGLSECLKQLNGHIKLIPGNHDKIVYKMMKVPELVPPNLEILDKIHSVQINGLNLAMCHFPIEDWHGIGDIHLHGHSHGTSAKKADRYDVGIDVYGKPIEITLEALNNPTGWLDKQAIQ